MRKYLLFVLLLLPIFAYAQKKMYIYPPKLAEYHSIDLFQNKTISLAFKDKRVITPKSKVKATFEQITNAISDALKQTYHKANFIGEKENADIQIKIDIKSYDVTFYTGMWHSQTRYIVSIQYNGKTYEDDLEQINRFYNVGGTITAKNNLNKCFNNANLKLIQFINDI